MRPKGTGHPTREILAFAQRAPGGVIRWHEARDIYVQESAAARKDERLALPGQPGNRHYHMSLQKVLRSNFEPVEGARGFYVLSHSIVNLDHPRDDRVFANP